MGGILFIFYYSVDAFLFGYILKSCVVLKEEKSPRFSRLGFLLLAYPGDLPVDGPVDSRCSKSDVAKRCFFSYQRRQAKTRIYNNATYLHSRHWFVVREYKKKGKSIISINETTVRRFLWLACGEEM